MKQLQAAAQELLARCDGAQARDGAGYSSFDRGFGEHLARRPLPWNARTTHNAYQMLRKYRKQLADYGINFSEIPEPPTPEPETTPITPAASGERKVEWDDEFVLIFPYDKAVVGAVRNLPARRFVPSKTKWGAKNWHADPVPRNAEVLADIISSHKFSVSQEAQEHLQALMGKATVDRTMELADGEIKLIFRPVNEILNKVRALPHRRFDKKPEPAWYAKLTMENLEPLMDLVREHDFILSSDAAEAMGEYMQEMQSALEASRAEDADLDPDLLDGFGSDVLSPYPFQKAGIKYALNKKRVIIGDQMGLGKTIQALAVIHATDSYPALVICPNSVKLNWAKEIIQWLPDGVSLSLLQGTKGEQGTTRVYVDGEEHLVPDNDFTADIIVTNYAILRFYSNQRTTDPDLPLNGISFKCVIADEAHRLKNKDTQQSKAAAQVFRNAEYKLLLTGTPIKSRVPEYVNLLRILGKCGGKTTEFGTKWDFLNSYAQKEVGRWGTKYFGGKNLTELNTRLRASCMVRRRKEQVLKELPDLTWADVPVEIDNRTEYDFAATETVEYIFEQARKDPEIRQAAFKKLMQRFAGDMAGKTFEEILDDLAKSKSRKAQYAIHLVRMIVLRSLAARGKLTHAYKWIDDFLENSDEKVILFAIHRRVQKALLERYDGAAHVLGDDSSTARQQNVDRFQDDEGCKIIVCSLYAASEGITLTAASNVVFLELGWTPAEMEQAAARAHRIGQDEAVTAWRLIAADTIEEKIASMLQTKKRIFEGAADGSVEASNDMLDALVEVVT